MHEFRTQVLRFFEGSSEDWSWFQNSDKLKATRAYSTHTVEVSQRLPVEVSGDSPFNPEMVDDWNWVIGITFGEIYTGSSGRSIEHALRGLHYRSLQCEEIYRKSVLEQEALRLVTSSLIDRNLENHL